MVQWLRPGATRSRLGHRSLPLAHVSGDHHFYPTLIDSERTSSGLLSFYLSPIDVPSTQTTQRRVRVWVSLSIYTHGSLVASGNTP